MTKIDSRKKGSFFINKWKKIKKKVKYEETDALDVEVEEEEEELAQFS